MNQTEQILSQLPNHPLAGLRQVDRLWQSLRQGERSIPTVVRSSPDALGSVDWDVVIAGGTLGILLATALVQRGWRVAVMERGMLRGREQEWNISRSELRTFLELDLLSEVELEQAIATEYNPVRIQFSGGPAWWVRDVLNVGVDPQFLLETLKQKFLQCGGCLLEQRPFTEAIVHLDGVLVGGEPPLKTRLLIDAMGHFSPIAQQARGAVKPDGICLVVGTCAQGIPANETGDLIVTFTPIKNQCQYFWEAFPAHDGRTTYLFTYLDAHPQRPSLETLFEDYWQLLPAYQGVELSQLQLQRALFGLFPAYRQSPLSLPWHRMMPVGDSSGSQSPLSFGGFGAMVRHLSRLTTGVDQALRQDCLEQAALSWLHPYQPNLSVTWLFQQAMSVGVDQTTDPDQVNRLLISVFTQMAQAGEDVLKPFLQDVVQFVPLSQTLLRTAIAHPRLITRLLPQLGIAALVNWMGHYSTLGLYSTLHPLGQGVSSWTKALPPNWQYYSDRLLQAWHYGSGADYASHQEKGKDKA